MIKQAFCFRFFGDYFSEKMRKTIWVYHKSSWSLCEQKKKCTFSSWKYNFTTYCYPINTSNFIEEFDQNLILAPGIDLALRDYTINMQNILLGLPKNIHWKFKYWGYCDEYYHNFCCFLLQERLFGLWVPPMMTVPWPGSL